MPSLSTKQMSGRANDGAAAVRVPFHRLSVQGREEAYLAQAIAAGQLGGDRQFAKRCEAFLERALGAPKALLTTSCTHALEMSAMLLDLHAGDEVIVPSFTFVSSANAFVLRGARPVFVDIRPDTLNLDDAQLERLVTSRTKAIIAMHYAGVGCEMDAILEVARRHQVAVIEDNAHGLFGTYQGRFLGTFGCLAAHSFHETKNITCGEGGALVINDPRFLDRAEIIREKGTDRTRFFRGHVDKYTWVDLGSSYLPSELQAAFLCAQLEGWESIQAARRRLWHRYATVLGRWAAERGIRLSAVPPHCESSYHVFALLVPSLKQRQALLSHLKAAGVVGAFHYLPLHLSAMGRRFGGREGQCPVTEAISDRLVRLPLYNGLTDEEQDAVIKAVESFEGR